MSPGLSGVLNNVGLKQMFETRAGLTGMGSVGTGLANAAQIEVGSAGIESMGILLASSTPVGSSAT